MAVSGLIKAGTKVAKAGKKPGRKSKRGRKPGTKAEKAEAKELGITVPELRKRKAKDQKKPPKKKKKTAPKRTRKEEKEYQKLLKEHYKDKKNLPLSSSTMRRTMVDAPRRSSVAGQQVEAGFPRSKTPPPQKQSAAAKRRRVMAGLQGITSGGRIKDTGTFADPRSMTAETMGLRSKGVLPSEEDLIKMGGFEIRKKGGKIGRGTGQALRGGGCVVGSKRKR